MGSPWPAPAADDRASGRGPNYALRRAIAVLVTIALIGGGIAWFVRRGADGDSLADGTGQRWNTVVLQDPLAGEVTLVDTEGEELNSFRVGPTGLLDVGLQDRLVVGAAGELSDDGLGVLDLDSGEVTELQVEGTTITRLGNSAYLLVSAGPRDPLSLIDVAGGDVIDLLALTGTSSPIVDSSLVRIDPQHMNVAFTELGELETVLVDLETRQPVSLAGSLADLASDAVLTITKRGQTSLVDLYGLDGERIGTVETPAAVGGLVLDDSTALIVTRAGELVRADFDDESVEPVSSIASQLTSGEDPDDTTASTDQLQEDGEVDAPELVRGVVPLLDRTRLVVLGDGAMTIVDLDGQVLASDRIAGAALPQGITGTDRCVLIGVVDSEQTLWDTEDGSRIETFDPGFMTGRSADGCVVTYDERSAIGADRNTDGQTRLVGPGIDRFVDGQLGAVAPDGSAAAGLNEEGTFVVDAQSGDLLPLDGDTLLAVFIDR